MMWKVQPVPENHLYWGIQLILHKCSDQLYRIQLGDGIAPMYFIHVKHPTASLVFLVEGKKRNKKVSEVWEYGGSQNP